MEFKGTNTEKEKAIELFSKYAAKIMGMEKGIIYVFFAPQKDTDQTPEFYKVKLTDEPTTWSVSTNIIEYIHIENGLSFYATKDLKYMTLKLPTANQPFLSTAKTESIEPAEIEEITKRMERIANHVKDTLNHAKLN